MMTTEPRRQSWPEKLTPENVANWLWTNMTSPWNAQEILRAMAQEALKEALAKMHRADESLASRYGFLRDSGGNDDRLNDLGCERAGVQTCIRIAEEVVASATAKPLHYEGNA